MIQAENFSRNASILSALMNTVLLVYQYNYQMCWCYNRSSTSKKFISKWE